MVDLFLTLAAILLLGIVAQIAQVVLSRWQSERTSEGAEGEQVERSFAVILQGNLMPSVHFDFLMGSGHRHLNSSYHLDWHRRGNLSRSSAASKHSD